MGKTIQIRCTGADCLPIDELCSFQGKIKKLSPANLANLKTRIITDGFIAPIFIWDNGADKMILDGHQRLSALLSLRAEGWGVPPVPVVFIDAGEISEAKRMLLSIASQYGQWDDEELREWIHDVDKSIIETIRLVDTAIDLDFKDEDEVKGNEPEYVDNLTTVCIENDVWLVGDKIKLYCASSENIKTNSDCIFFDPMFEIDGIYNTLPDFVSGRKLLMFWDMLRCGIANKTAIEKGYDFKYEMILDCCTSWYIPGRPLERHKSAGVAGDIKWNFDSAIYLDGQSRDDMIVSNSRGSYEYKALDSGKHLSSVERFNNAAAQKQYQYEKPLMWIRALLNGMGPIEDIFDPYAGSFTAAIVAYENGWGYEGYEISPNVVDIGLMKIYNATGISAVNIQTGEDFISLLDKNKNTP